jgi:hypothetical protein
MVGTLIELADVINRHSYTKTNTPALIEEQNAARQTYRRFLLWFHKKYRMFLGDHCVTPFYAMRRTLVEVAAAITVYKRERDSLSEEGCTADSVHFMVTEWLKQHWPDLVPKFKQLVAKPHRTFGWTGPDLRILQLVDISLPPAILNEVLDFPDEPIIISDQDDDVDMGVAVAPDPTTPVDELDSDQDMDISSEDDVPLASVVSSKKGRRKQSDPGGESFCIFRSHELKHSVRSAISRQPEASKAHFLTMGASRFPCGPSLHAAAHRFFFKFLHCCIVLVECRLCPVPFPALSLVVK